MFRVILAIYTSLKIWQSQILTSSKWRSSCSLMNVCFALYHFYGVNSESNMYGDNGLSCLQSHLRRKKSDMNPFCKMLVSVRF